MSAAAAGTVPRTGGLGSPPYRSRLAAHLASVVVYAVLALWATWPLARYPATALPLGTSPVATVPLFNLWTIWWNADRLAHGLRGYWDAPIFHPAKDAFAFSEPQPTTMLVAPIVWLTGSRVLAYNSYLWLSLVLNGKFAERLLRRLWLARVIAVGGGAAMLLLPIVHWQREVVQLIPLWGILWTWTALLNISRRPTILRGAELGAAFAVSCLTCVHHGLFLAFLLGAAAWTLWRWREWIRLSWACLAATMVCIAIAGPVVARLHDVADQHAFTRSTDTVAALSAMPGDYTAAFGRLLIGRNGSAARLDWFLSPGWIKLGLAAVGVLFGLTSRCWRRWTGFLLVTASLAFVLSLGPNFHLGGWQPWWTLTEHIPGFAQVRNVYRFAYFVQIAAVLLAAQGLHAMFVLVRRFTSQGLRRSAGLATATVLGIGAIFEVLPKPPRLAVVPDAAANAGWISFVRDHTRPGGAIVCLPFPASLSVTDQEFTTKWMYFGTFHGVPMVNGYSGFFPPEYFDIRSAANERPLTEAFLRTISDANADLLVVSRSSDASGELRHAVFESVSIELLFDDPVGIDVFRVQRRNGPPGRF